MAETLIAAVDKMIGLAPAEREALQAAVRRVRLKRKEHLLREGEVCSFSAFISSGCLRYYYLVDGEERTGQFFFENSWYSDYESFLSRQPSLQNIQALETTEVLTVSREQWERMYVEHPRFERFGRLMAERAFLGLRSKTKLLTLASPEERYQQLMAERPLLFERVPLKHIASYLSVKPESLSRIRKRLLEARRPQKS
ncbi:MAG: Crp/Fnr family transcriptional regulator [Chitinophagales bacterium]|nr:Crp/Fnr family transcriptional regulator [Chitinophagales bacterium]